MFEEMIEKVKEYKLACGLVLAGALVGGFFLLQGPAPAAQEAPVEPSQHLVMESSSSETATSSQQASSSEATFLTVDVKGAVKKPGVYELAAGSRVKDAIQEAGGLLEDADSKSVNLAQKVQDEAVIYVAKQGEAGADVTTQAGGASQTGTGAQATGQVNLNTATLAELQTVSGIGAKRAQDIIDYRETNGKFKSLDDLKNVSGIGAKTLEKLKAYVTVG